MNPLEIDKKVREELLKLSMEYTIYAICDGSYIFDDGNTQTLYGEGYILNNRNIEKICDDGKKLVLKR